MTGRNTSRFSLLSMAVAVVTVGVGTAAGLVLVPLVGTYVGTLAGAFVAGLAIEDRPVVEAGIAGVLAGLGVLVAGTLVGSGVVDAVVALASIDPVTVLISALLSFAVGAFGAHFGDDVRDGLTDPVEEHASGTTPLGGAGPTLSDSADEDESQERSETTREDPERAKSDDRRSETRESRDVELEGPE